jgi:tellurite resistance protein TerC
MFLFTWQAFTLLVLAMLTLDFFQTRNDVVSIKKSLIWSLFWLLLAFVFAGAIYLFWPQMVPSSHYSSYDASIAFLTGYLLEKSLSVDNLFVFAIIFGQFSVPEHIRPRVLLWGIIGALILRAVMIYVGSDLLMQYHWLLYVFAAFLIYTAFKLWFNKDEDTDDFTQSTLVLWLKKHANIDNEYHGYKFFIKKSATYIATPLLLVIIVISFTDIMFALDSIPAIFSVTREPFLVLSANVFALLGLRSLYFVLEGMLEKFYYLQPALALILGFIGVKMLLIGSAYEIPTNYSLLVIVTVISGAIVGSVYKNKQQEKLAKI